MVDADILRRLAALKLPAEAFQEILTIIADVTAADESRRERGRRRTSKWRQTHRSDHHSDVTSDVTVTSLSQSHRPPVYNTPPKKIDSKNLSIPADFEPDLSFAIAKGWSETYARAEASRFRDHALAKGRKCRDWNAAWRNWVTSPYQGTQKTSGINGESHDPLERRNGESLGDLGRRLADEARRREALAGIAEPTLPLAGD